MPRTSSHESVHGFQMTFTARLRSAWLGGHHPLHPSQKTNSQSRNNFEGVGGAAGAPHKRCQYVSPEKGLQAPQMAAVSTVFRGMLPHSPLWAESSPELIGISRWALSRLPSRQLETLHKPNAEDVKEMTARALG